MTARTLSRNSVWMNPQTWGRKTALALALVAITAVGVAGGANVAQAQTHNGVVNNQGGQNMNVLQLSAEGMVEVQQDWMVTTLSTSKEGRDAATVQAQLQKAVESAMAVARAKAKDGEMEVSSGSFNVTPRYTKADKIDGWRGTAEVVLQGRNFVQITQTAAQINELQIADIGFNLSREAREKVTGEAQTKAVQEFKRQALSLSKNFGFNGFSLREVNVSSSSSGGSQPRMMQAMAKSNMASFDAAPVPVEAGKAQVVVTVAGSVQLK